MPSTCHSCEQPISESISTIRIMINGTAYTFCSTTCMLQMSQQWLNPPTLWGKEA